MAGLDPAEVAKRLSVSGTPSQMIRRDLGVGSPEGDQLKIATKPTGKPADDWSQKRVSDALNLGKMFRLIG